MRKGTFIVVEGPEGSGKTTLIENINQSLDNVYCFREPGGTELSEIIRNLVKGQDDIKPDIGKRAEALLFAAARAQLTEEQLKPLLKQNKTVIVDRFIDSSIIYQGTHFDKKEIINLSEFATGGLKPDLVFVLSLPYETALKRMQARDEHFDRMEASFDLKAIHNKYVLLAEQPHTVKLDASLSPDEILECALKEIRKLV